MITGIHHHPMPTDPATVDDGVDERGRGEHQLRVSNERIFDKSEKPALVNFAVKQRSRFSLFSPVKLWRLSE